MADSYLSKRLVAALVLLAIVATTCVSLGNWQLDRAAERDAIAEAIQQGKESGGLLINARAAPEQLQDWRPAHATGTWLPEFTVLLDNRNYNGRPGLWVATPLLLDDGSGMALVVLRGWLPRPVAPGDTLPDLSPPAGLQTVSGQILGHVPRLFELWSPKGTDPNALPRTFPANDNPLPRVQNLNLTDYASATGLKLLPVVLEQTSAEDGGPDLIQDWPLPPTDSDTNRGYALQWFSFAAIAITAWIVIVGRALRTRRRKSRITTD